MRILAIDTALGACAACVMEAEAQEPLAQETLVMERGHAEALLPLLDRLVSTRRRRLCEPRPGRRDGRPRELHRPSRRHRRGARASGLPPACRWSASRPCRHSSPPLVADDNRRLLAAAIDAKHGHVYFQAISPGGQSIVAPSLVRVRDAARLMARHGLARRLRRAGGRGRDRRHRHRRRTMSKPLPRHRLGGAARPRRGPRPGPAETALSSRARRAAAGRPLPRR